jgi:hypothetical protein
MFTLTPELVVMPGTEITVDISADVPAMICKAVALIRPEVLVFKVFSMLASAWVVPCEVKVTLSLPKPMILLNP